MMTGDREEAGSDTAHPRTVQQKTSILKSVKYTFQMCHKYISLFNITKKPEIFYSSSLVDTSSPHPSVWSPWLQPNSLHAHTITKKKTNKKKSLRRKHTCDVFSIPQVQVNETQQQPTPFLRSLRSIAVAAEATGPR